MVKQIHVAPMVELRDVQLRRGKCVFGPFNASVQRGERIAILGPSGAGKSTLLRLIANELLPSQGTIRFHGRALRDWSLGELSRQRAVLPQSHEVALGLHGRLVVALGRVARAHDPSLNDIIDSAAALAHASHLLDKPFSELSGGEQARVQLARVFAQLWDCHDCLVLVDEPLAALDPGLQQDLIFRLDTYVTQRHHTLIAVLHDINQAMQNFYRMWLVKDGVMVNDLPCNMDVVPHLEGLYGLPLTAMTTSDKQVFIAPARRSSHLTLGT